ncbi:hypothetical protein G6F48_009009 [Rhizopus delemar]|nr:hypothetical protein G6F48_009009 [Rhizopus delemar]
MAKFNTDYFYLTPAKKWKLIDAIDYFDKLNSYNSFYEILLDLSAALNKIKATQASFKKYVKSMEEELMKLLKLNIYAREPPLDNQENITPIAQGISNTTQNLPAETQENSNIEKLSDVLNNHGQINVRPNHATFISSKALGKRQADQINDGDPTLTNPLPRNATPSEFEIDEGPNHYQMSSPSVHVEHPHKPKLRRLQISNLIELFHFGTSFSRSNPITNAEYLTYEEDQQINKSLKSLNILHHLVYLLEEIPYDQFNATLWIKNVDNLDRRSCTFLDINNMELIVVESSSGRLKEHTSHTIEDSLKVLECGVAALKKEAIHYKNASLDTFKKLKVYSVQIIKTQVTLSELSLFNESHWKFVEKRSAKLPTNWNDRLEMIQYLELLATLFVCNRQHEGYLYYNHANLLMALLSAQYRKHPALIRMILIALFAIINNAQM